MPKPSAVRVLAAALLTVVCVASAGAQAAMPMPQIWTGRMQVPAGVEPGETGDTFELRIFRASTDVEAAGLVTALKAGGQVALRNAMYQLPARGWIKIGNLAATDAVFVRVVDLPDGRRRVRLYSDHALRLYDKSDPAGSTAHPFAYLELFADASGKGSGSLVASASLAADARRIADGKRRPTGDRDLQRHHRSAAGGAEVPGGARHALTRGVTVRRFRPQSTRRSSSAV